MSAHAAPAMSARRVSLIGALLVAVGPIAMSLYLPSMAEIVRAFDTTPAMVKLTLTLYFGGFACAQLIAGPLSDALGRRPVTFLFIGGFSAASLLALFAPTIEFLIVARFLQGVGASAGVAVSRAIVRDTFSGEDSVRIMNLIGIILGLGPALAPTIGGLMITLAGWRSVFLLMALFGMAIILIMALGTRETASPDRAPLRLRGLASAYRLVLADRQFLTASLVIGGAVGAIYAESTFLPFILIDMVGLSPTQFGAGMLLHSGAFLTGSMLMRVLMARVRSEKLVLVGLGFILAGSLAMTLLLVWGPGFLRVMVPVAIYSFGIAFVMPSMTTAALAPFSRNAGAASAMMGFIQMGSGLFFGTIGAMIGAPIVAMGVLIPLMGALACIAYMFFRRIA